MDEYQVTCINKPDRNSHHEHITHIGNADGNWKLTREDAIHRIDTKQAAFYTIDFAANRKVYVGVVREQGKAPYLRTHTDGKWTDNLLALDECGPNCKIPT